MGKLLILGAYSIYAAFWVRFFMHILVWRRALGRLEPAVDHGAKSPVRACLLTGMDVLFLGRLFRVNPALWFGEWIFHATFLLVLARHLRYFLDPIPAWVWSVQTPGMIAGYVLPFSLLYILAIRLLTAQEKYSSRANLLLLGIMLLISSVGVLMHLAFKPDLVGVKLFVFGIMTFAPQPAPESGLFILHFTLFLALVAILPTHIFTAPLVMYEARKRDEALHGVMHEK